MDSVMKELMGAVPSRNFWARTAPVSNICQSFVVTMTGFSVRTSSHHS